MDHNRYEKDLAAYLLVVYSHFMSTLVCFNWQATKLLTIQILWPVHNQSVGSKKRQAEPLTEEEEEILWQEGLLGDHSPQALLDTMVFMNGLYFALRSGNEHRNLRFSPCQIEVNDNEGERPCIPTVHRRSLQKPPRWPERKTNQSKSGSSLRKH